MRAPGIKAVEVMGWARDHLGLKPHESIGLFDSKDPDWPRAINAYHISYAPERGAAPEFALILPVVSGMAGHGKAMVIEAIEAGRDAGTAWYIEIRRMYKADAAEWDTGRMAFSYTVGDHAWWEHAEEIADVMRAEFRREPEAYTLTLDFSEIDSFNHAEPRGKVSRPDGWKLALAAAHIIDRKRPGAYKSLQRHEGPWQLLALRVGYAELQG
jgi:hypothetical protein